MSEFHDPDLRRQLSRMSGPYPDDNAAFAAWQRRVGQARRRRAVAWTTGAAMSLVMGTITVSALQNPGRNSVVPGKSLETITVVTVSIATTEADESSTSESTAPETIAPTTLAPDTTPSTVIAADTSMPESDDNGAAGSRPTGSTSKGPGPGVGPTTTAAPQTSEPPQTATKTVTSIGGAVTVRRDGDRLTVTAINPAAGFEADENDSGDRVRVTFTSGDHKSEITVRLSEGAIKADVSEKSESHDTSVSGDSSGDSSGEASSDDHGGDDNE